ncbi:MAG: hypothetical protein OXF79_20835 [Chloroflexi bacterium]|nr:hypothetical protein [Chloroflexota bacterium]
MHSFMSKMPGLIMVAVVVSLVAMALTHMDLLPPSYRTPILDMVRDETDCATATGKDDCAHTVMQLRSLMAALAAAMCTISTVAASTRKWQAIYGSIAGLAALKAVFHQFMYIMDGSLTIPLTVVIVAAMVSVIPAVAVLSISSSYAEKKE